MIGLGRWMALTMVFFPSCDDCRDEQSKSHSLSSGPIPIPQIPLFLNPSVALGCVNGLLIVNLDIYSLSLPHPTAPMTLSPHPSSHSCDIARRLSRLFRATRPPQVLSDRISGYVQAYTCYGSVRPFGISTLVAGADKTGPRLFCIEPSGVFYGYRACAVGKGRALARTELEKVLAKEGGVSVREGVMEVARM
jgi:hypothetical protein